MPQQISSFDNTDICYKYCLEGLVSKRQENMLQDLRLLAMAWLWLSAPMLNQEQWTTPLYTSSQHVPSFSVSFLPSSVKTVTTIPTMDSSDIYYYKQTSRSLHMKELSCFISFFEHIYGTMLNLIFDILMEVFEYQFSL